ncbi:MAG: hypothetical protein ABIP94_18150 [Planctomycetota bacterium]
MSADAVGEFSPRTARFVGGVAMMSLLAAFLLLLSPGEGRKVVSVDADGYSRSAIGHFGLLQLLRELGLPVLQIRRAHAVDSCGLFVTAEPRASGKSDKKRIAKLVDGAPRTLVVLPKREGVVDPEAPHWVARVSLLPEQKVVKVLEQVAEWTAPPAPKLVRVDAVTDWHSEHSWPAPTLGQPAQLLDTDRSQWEPLITCAEGTLLARLGKVWVLSDPDLIANHGLQRGLNTDLVLAILEHLRQDGTIAFDETMHGHLREPTIWTAMGEFPLVLVPAHLLLMLAIVLWIAHTRFGRPVPVPPPIGGGKAFLIDNIAALLRRGGHHGPSLRRYCRHRIRHAAERLHAPRGLSDEQCRDWLLARMHDGAAREELSAMLEQGDTHTPSQAVAAAQRIRTLTEETLHAV